MTSLPPSHPSPNMRTKRLLITRREHEGVIGYALTLRAYATLPLQFAPLLICAK